MTTTDRPSSHAGEAPSPADALCERLFGSAVGFLEILSCYFGDRLGLYVALRDLGDATSAELAAHARISERYAREWLEHQATAGILVGASVPDDTTVRRYRLPDRCSDALTEPDDLANILPLTRVLVAAARQVDGIAGAFASGGGVPWSSYGTEMLDGQAAMNRPVFMHLLPGWIESVPDIHARLQTGGARVADVACGAAWSSVAIARAYPSTLVDAFDSDQASAEVARANVKAAGLDDRVRVQAIDAAALPDAERYDLVTIFEALHDMARPVEALTRIRGVLAEHGSVLVMDEAVGESFETPGPVDAFMYGASLAVCLPAAMAEVGAVGTGTVMRRSTLERYARDAGFARVEVLPIEHPFFRIYRLVNA